MELLLQNDIRYFRLQDDWSDEGAVPVRVSYLMAYRIKCSFQFLLAFSHNSLVLKKIRLVVRPKLLDNLYFMG